MKLNVMVLGAYGNVGSIIISRCLARADGIELVLTGRGAQPDASFPSSGMDD